MSEGLSKISSNFTLHLIKVGKLKRFEKVSSDLKTILKTDLGPFQTSCYCRAVAVNQIRLLHGSSSTWFQTSSGGFKWLVHKPEFKKK